jgi:hypothetical protein
MFAEFHPMTPLAWPVWTAALVAVRCRARKNGESDPIYWQIGQDYVLYTATEKVVVEPFGIAMAAGDVLEVRWEPGETGYRVIVRRPEQKPRQAGHSAHSSSEPRKPGE